MKNYINKSITASNGMRKLIQNLLQYSQLGKIESSDDRVSVDEILNHPLQNLRTSVDGSRAQITIENEVDFIAGDRVELVQLTRDKSPGD
ncbi:MAG: PAS domain-containing sensor histidine kinase, partial [Chitinophagaceae bacterium]